MTKPSLTPAQDAAREASAQMHAQMAALPAERRSPERAFTAALIDLCLSNFCRWQDEHHGNPELRVDWMAFALANAILSLSGSFHITDQHDAEVPPAEKAMDFAARIVNHVMRLNLVREAGAATITGHAPIKSGPHDGGRA